MANLTDLMTVDDNTYIRSVYFTGQQLMMFAALQSQDPSVPPVFDGAKTVVCMLTYPDSAPTIGFGYHDNMEQAKEIAYKMAALNRQQLSAHTGRSRRRKLK